MRIIHEDYQDGKKDILFYGELHRFHIKMKLMILIKVNNA